MKSKFIGVNIQFPISQKILSGEKSVETRTYPMPSEYEDRELLMIETPGKTGKFKARIVAKICFGKSYLYRSKKEFYADFNQHQVDPESPWAWGEKPKWGWPIKSIKLLKKTIDAPKKKGIVFTKNLSLGN